MVCQADPNCEEPTLKGQSPFCRKHAQKGAAAQRLMSPLTGWEPHYMPSVYNNEQKIQHNHNCFAYAFDVIDMPTCKDDKCKFPFHQPGYKAGHPRFSDDGKKYCGDLLMRLFADMPFLKRTTFTKQCPPGHSKIALVIDPQNDYHFYRQDSNGLWSHKPGGQKVTNLDSEGKLIYNPELCSRDYRTREAPKKDELNYSVFCSFLCVPRNRPAETKRGGYNRMAGGHRTLKKRRVGGGHSKRIEAKKEAAARRAAQEAAAAAAGAGAGAGAGAAAPRASASRSASTTRRVPIVGASGSRKKTHAPVNPRNKVRLELLNEARGSRLTQLEKHLFIREGIEAAKREKEQKEREREEVVKEAKRLYPENPSAAIRQYYAAKAAEMAKEDAGLAEMIAGLSLGPAPGAGAGAGGHPAAAPAYPAAAAGAENLSAAFAAWSLGPPGGR